MTKLLQVGNDIFEYPQQGTGEGHGEDATAWAEAVTATLSSIRGPNDILLTTANLANGATDETIPGLSFNTGQVQHVNIEFLIQRIADSGNQVLVESGKIYGNYDGSDFTISIESTGVDTGITIDVDNSGQFIYSSTALLDHQSSIISFKANTIDG
jgi:hypothetical protein